RTVLTIHNAAFQGLFPPARGALAAFGLDGEHPELRDPKSGYASMLRGGVLAADRIVTVSRTYARDLILAQYGHGLETILATKRPPVRGIVNGIDTDVWNPATDPALAAPYDAETRSGKAACKAAILAELGLEARAGRPLAVHVGRLFPE